MNKMELVRELEKIIDGIDGDTFTADNLLELIKKIKKEGVSLL
jgi:hypothetical protein